MFGVFSSCCLAFFGTVSWFSTTKLPDRSAVSFRMRSREVKLPLVEVFRPRKTPSHVHNETKARTQKHAYVARLAALFPGVL